MCGAPSFPITGSVGSYRMNDISPELLIVSVALDLCRVDCQAHATYIVSGASDCEHAP